MREHHVTALTARELEQARRELAASLTLPVERRGGCLPVWPVRGAYRADGKRLRGGLVGGGTVPMIARRAPHLRRRRASVSIC